VLGPVILTNVRSMHRSFACENVDESLSDDRESAMSSDSKSARWLSISRQLPCARHGV